MTIATEAPNNDPSVTNSAAALATQVWRELLPQAREGLRWIEVYLDLRDPNPVYRERFAEVEFQLGRSADGDELRAGVALHRPRRRRGAHRRPVLGAIQK